jgi:hypothetical protein
VYSGLQGQVLLENEKVRFEKYVLAPGQPEHSSGPFSPDGSVGWMRIVEISEGHESHNEGSNPIDLIWVTLKD